MAQVIGAGGFFVKARHPDALYAWYERHLGLRREKGAFIFPAGHGPGYTVLAFFPHDTEYFGPSGQPAMLNLRVTNLDELLKKLDAAGVEIDPRREEYGYGRFAWITDGEGNRVELWEPSSSI